MNNKRYTKEEVLKLYNKYLAGGSLNSVGQELGTSREAVRQLFNRHNLTDRTYNGKDTFKRIQKYGEENLRELSGKEIYQLTGVKPHLVRLYFNKMGVSLKRSVNSSKVEISKQRLINLYIKNNLRLDDIAAMYGITRITVARRLKEFNIYKRK